MDWVFWTSGGCSLLALVGLGLYHYSIWREIRDARRETSKFPR